MIEEIKDHQSSEIERLGTCISGRNRSRRCGCRNSDRRDLGQGQQARKQRLTKPADRNDPLPIESDHCVSGGCGRKVTPTLTVAGDIVFPAP